MANELLFNAVRSGDYDRVQLLLAGGVDPNLAEEQSGEGALALAAAQGDVRVVRALLDAGADPDGLGTLFAPLAEAAGNGHSSVVEMLLMADSDVDAVDEDGATALGAAAAAGHVESINLLLEAGANPRHEDRQGNVPAVYALEQDRNAALDILLPFSPPIVRHRITVRRAFRSQTIGKERIKKYFDAVMRGRYDDVSRGLAAGIPVDVLASEEGATALMWAANKGHLALVELLLQEGADANRQEVYGYCALTFAATNGKGPTYEYLLRVTDKRFWRRAEKHKEVSVARRQWIE